MNENQQTTKKLDKKLEKKTHCPYEEWFFRSKYRYKTCEIVTFSSFLLSPKWLLILSEICQKCSPKFFVRKLLSELLKSEIFVLNVLIQAGKIESVEIELISSIKNWTD